MEEQTPGLQNAAMSYSHCYWLVLFIIFINSVAKQMIEVIKIPTKINAQKTNPASKSPVKIINIFCRVKYKLTHNKVIFRMKTVFLYKIVCLGIRGNMINREMLKIT